MGIDRKLATKANVKDAPLLSPAPPAPAHAPGDAAAVEVVRLKRDIAARDDLLALAAHELRNPLHALALHLALALASAQNGGNGEVADRIGRAELTLRRYSERVTVLMELLASPGARYPLAPRSVDVQALLRTLADSLDQEARSRGIAVDVAVELAREGAGAPFVRRVDPVALEQAVDNLLLNAFKHSGATTVRLRLRSEPGFWCVQVEDNGNGIAAQDQRAIFDKFAVATHSSRGTGTGLGLWIVTRLVQAMNASISLASAPGEGCVFTIRIPEETT